MALNDNVLIVIHIGIATVMEASFMLSWNSVKTEKYTCAVASLVVNVAVAVAVTDGT